MLGFRVRWVREEVCRSQRGSAVARLVAIALTAVGVSQAIPPPVSAQTSTYYTGGSLSASIPIFEPVRSVTLTPGTVVFNVCQNFSANSVLAGLTRTQNG